MKMVVLVSKALALGFWAWVIAAIGGMDVPGASMAPMFGAVIAAAHVVELAVLLPRLKKMGGSTGSHAIGLLLFGVIHYNGAKLAAQTNSETT